MRDGNWPSQLKLISAHSLNNHRANGFNLTWMSTFEGNGWPSKYTVGAVLKHDHSDYNYLVTLWSPVAEVPCSRCKNNKAQLSLTFSCDACANVALLYHAVQPNLYSVLAEEHLHASWKCVTIRSRAITLVSKIYHCVISSDLKQCFESDATVDAIYV